MKRKNKFDTFDKIDDFDKMLFEYYDNKNDDIPLSTQKAIDNSINTAFNNTSKSKHKLSTFTMLKRVAVFILSLGIITATTVYAKDIVNFITSLFNNTNSGIDTAVDNGHLQNVDMDFIECNDIGLKVDYLLMDNHNLNISFVYKYLGEEVNIKSIKYEDLIIKNEKGDILCSVSDNPIQTTNMIQFDITSTSEQEFIDNFTIRDSLLVTSKNLPVSETLYIDITKIELNLYEEIKYIDGNWSFSINVDNKTVIKNSYNHYFSNPYVNSVKTNLDATALSIELELNTLFNDSILYRHGTITLKDSNNKTYRPTKMLSQKDDSSGTSTITLFYPISVYDNIDKLYLNVKLDTDKQIDIELSK